MPSMKLTDRFVASLKPATRTTYFDNKVVGLGLRASPTGGRAWWFVYRLQGKPSQWLKLGSYPAMSLADARKAALAQRKAVDVDRSDPVAERKTKAKAAPAVFTFADLAKLYLTLAKATKKDWKNDQRKIDKHLLPAWGARPLRSIVRTDVHELLDRLVTDGMGPGVNRVQALISRLFTVALDRSLVDAHPATRMIKRAKEQARERTLSDDEIRELWKGLDQRPGPAADAVKLRLLLGQRGDETFGMRWPDVDLETGIWQLPATMTKNSRPQAIPLSTTALQIVTARRKMITGDEPRVFPGLSRQATPYRDLAVIHQGRYQWRDLRRTMATRIAGLGINETTIGRALNHARYTVTAKHYNQHLYLNEIGAALQTWDDELHRILERRKARTLKKLADIVPIGRGR